MLQKFKKCLNFLPLKFAHSADEHFHTVTEGVVHVVYNAVIRSCFGVIQQLKVSGGIWRLSLSVMHVCTAVALPSDCYLRLHTMSNQWPCMSYLMDMWIC